MNNLYKIIPSDNYNNYSYMVISNQLLISDGSRCFAIVEYQNGKYWISVNTSIIKEVNLIVSMMRKFNFDYIFRSSSSATVGLDRMSEFYTKSCQELLCILFPCGYHNNYYSHQQHEDIKSLEILQNIRFNSKIYGDVYDLINSIEKMVSIIKRCTLIKPIIKDEYFSVISKFRREIILDSII